MLLQLEVCTEGTAPGTGAAAADTVGPAAVTTGKCKAGLTLKDRYRAAHGTLMILAWGILIPLAIGEAAAKRSTSWCATVCCLRTDAQRSCSSGGHLVFCMISTKGLNRSLDRGSGHGLSPQCHRTPVSCVACSRIWVGKGRRNMHLANDCTA